MSIKTLVYGVLAVASAFCFTSETFGQRSPCRLNQGFRYLGGGHSAGYHWRTPGPCVDYYNPWSHHNTSTRTGIVPRGAGPYLTRLEHCGETFQSFNQPSGFGQDGDFVGEFAFEPLPVQSPRANMLDSDFFNTDETSESNSETIRNEAESSGMHINANN